jgi:bisphosphoglycerate-independent phosphoglycerate mutase (AlkP superfamily)
MTQKVMRPYSVYLPEEYIVRIKEMAKERKAAALVRDAIVMALDGDDSFKAGYNKALRDVVGLVDNINEIKVIAINGKYLADLMADQIEGLKMN